MTTETEFLTLLMAKIKRDYAKANLDFKPFDNHYYPALIGIPTRLGYTRNYAGRGCDVRCLFVESGIRVEATPLRFVLPKRDDLSINWRSTLGAFLQHACRPYSLSTFSPDVMITTSYSKKRYMGNDELEEYSITHQLTMLVDEAHTLALARQVVDLLYTDSDLLTHPSWLALEPLIVVQDEKPMINTILPTK